MVLIRFEVVIGLKVSMSKHEIVLVLEVGHVNEMVKSLCVRLMAYQ